VVEGLSFTVGEGDRLIVFGENGSGKSTLMKAMLRLTAPLSGTVEYGGGLSNKDIGYLPQQTSAQKDFPASVREVVRSGLLGRRGLRPYYDKAERRAADDAMDRFGIRALSARCYRELSGGQQQRVLLARAMCAGRRAVFLDEPTAGLDPQATAEFYALVKGVGDGGVTVVMVSHDMAAVGNATHILHIGGKSALYDGPVDGYAESGVGFPTAGLGVGTG